MNKPGYIRTAAGQVSLVHSLLSFLPARIYSLKIFGRPLGLYSNMEKKGHLLVPSPLLTHEWCVEAL